MRVTIERDVLDAALGRVCAVVERRSTIPIISHVLLRAGSDGLSLTATDLDIEMAETVAAQVETKGALTVPADLLCNFVRSLPSGAEVALKLDEATGRLKVNAGRSRAGLPMLLEADFPRIGEHVLPFGGVVERDLLVRLFGQVAHAMSTEETRYYLNGLYLTTPVVEGSPRLRLVGTDGHRMACADAALPEGFAPLGCGGVIVPAKTVSMMQKLAAGAKALELSVSDSRVRLAADGAVLSSKVIDGAYPDYERVIPQADGVTATAVGFDPALFLGAVKRVSAFNDEKVRTVKLVVEGGQASLTARGMASGAEGGEEFEADHKDGRVETGFNARYLLDLLPLIGRRASFAFTASADPVLITDPDLPGVRHVLMPLRV